jgi:hypothetical protein
MLELTKIPTLDEIDAQENEWKNKKEITEIRILDKSGNIKQKWSYAKTGISNAKQIQLDNLPADIYTIVVFDGKNWTAEKIIKQ